MSTRITELKKVHIWADMQPDEIAYCKKCERNTVDQYCSTLRAILFRCSSCKNVEIEYKEPYAKINLDHKKFMAYLERTAKATNQEITVNITVDHDKFDEYDYPYEDLNSKYGCRYLKKYAGEKVFAYIFCRNTEQHFHVQ